MSSLALGPFVVSTHYTAARLDEHRSVVGVTACRARPSDLQLTLLPAAVAEHDRQVDALGTRILQAGAAPGLARARAPSGHSFGKPSYYDHANDDNVTPLEVSSRAACQVLSPMSDDAAYSVSE